MENERKIIFSSSNSKFSNIHFFVSVAGIAIRHWWPISCCLPEQVNRTKKKKNWPHIVKSKIPEAKNKHKLWNRFVFAILPRSFVVIVEFLYRFSATIFIRINYSREKEQKSRICDDRTRSHTQTLPLSCVHLFHLSNANYNQIYYVCHNATRFS